MYLLKETTEWKGQVPNHTYVVSDNKSKLYAYIKEGTFDLIVLKTPLDFEVKGRKFLIKKASGLDYLEKKEKKNSVEVIGSKGDTYYVTNDNGNWSCTCVGFKFQGRCKHIEKVKNQN